MRSKGGASSLLAMMLLAWSCNLFVALAAYSDPGQCGSVDLPVLSEVPSCLSTKNAADIDPAEPLWGACSPCFTEALTKAYANCLTDTSCSVGQDRTLTLNFYLPSDLPLLNSDNVTEIMSVLKSWTSTAPLKSLQSAGIKFALGTVKTAASNTFDVETVAKAGLDATGLQTFKKDFFSPQVTHYGLAFSAKSKEAQMQASIVNVFVASSWGAFGADALGVNPTVLAEVGAMIMLDGAKVVKTNSAEIAGLLVHELGHVLGLFHVHRGMFGPNNAAQCGTCKPGPGSYDNGDFIGDTAITPSPDHPNLGSDPSDPNAVCGIVVDSSQNAACWGASLASMGAARNAMSYIYTFCTDSTAGFTAGQLGRARCVFDLHLSAAGVPVSIQKAAGTLGLKYAGPWSDFSGGPSSTSGPVASATSGPVASAAVRLVGSFSSMLLLILACFTT